MKSFDVIIEWMEWNHGAGRGNVSYVRIEKAPLIYLTWRSRRKANREMDQAGAVRQKASGLTLPARANRDSSKMRRL